jgi:hypothetical protein
MYVDDTAPRGQRGDGCHDSQGCRAPRAVVTAGFAVIVASHAELVAAGDDSVRRTAEIFCREVDGEVIRLDGAMRMAPR